MSHLKGSTPGFAGGALALLCVLLSACGGQDPILGGANAAARPTVSSTTPGPDATAVSINTRSVSATLSEPVSPFTGTAGLTLTCAAPCTAPAGTVALDSTSRIATFTLASTATLLPLTRYTATLTGASSVATGLTLLNPYVWSFTTGALPDLSPPVVTVTIPAPGATGVFVNRAIVAGFSEDMAAASITETSFTLTCTLPCVSPARSVSYDSGSRSAIYTPAVALDANTTYTATLTTAITDDAGNSLSGNQGVAPAPSNFVWSFTTGLAGDTTRPAVTITVPATTSPGPTAGVAVNTAITAAFTEDMNPATLGATSFTLSCATPCVAPSGTVTYQVSSRTAQFAPAAALAANTTYSARITAAATDLAGNALAGNQTPLGGPSDYLWTFSTGAAGDTVSPTVTISSPTDGAVNVCTNKTMSSTFSEPMDGATITAATYTLNVTGGAAVTGLVTYDSQTRIARLDPLLPLTGTPPTSYTSTLLGGANGIKDLAGNPLAANVVTVFTTNASTCATAPVLGAAAPFGSYGGTATVTNDGLNTVINGDLGATAASSSITGFRDSGGNVYTTTTNNNGFVNGLVYTLTAPPGSVAGLAVTQANTDAQLAFNSISPAVLPGGIDVSNIAQCPSCGGVGAGAGELAGRTLPPGIYLSAAPNGSFDIGGAGQPPGDLVLDGAGDADAVWIFQTTPLTGRLDVGLTGPTTPAVPIQVRLINGAQAKNVFWYVPAGASIGTGSTMSGTMLADASITMSTTGGSPPTAVVTTVNGRAISLTAAVTMTNTVINVPAP